MKKVSILLNDENVFEIKNDNQGYYFMIDEYRAQLPPHFSGKHLSVQEVFTFFLEKLDDIGVGVVANYIFSLIKERKKSKVQAGNKSPADTAEQLQKDLKEDA